MRPPITVRPATAADIPACVAILAAAFQDDPALSWLYRDAGRRPEQLARFFRLICTTDADPAHWRVAIGADGGPVAVALWRPPGRWQIPILAMIGRLPALIGTFGSLLPRALAMQALLDANHARDPHWYLQFVGCAPAAQGQGHGGAVIRTMLAEIGAMPAYLETATESNVGLYRSLGFDLVKTYAVTEGPLFWSMWRNPA